MKKLLGLGLLLSIGCSEHKINIFDSSKVTASCTIAVECEMEQIDDNDSYDLDDDEIYKQYLMEACVDSFYDSLATAKLFDCGSEFKDMAACLSEDENIIDQCDYDFTDQDEYEDYVNDSDELYNETCWPVSNAYQECINL
jgi:hypothetical protein